MNKFGNKMNEVLEVGKFNKSRVMWVSYLMKNYKILIIGEVSNLELVTCQFANIIDKLLCLRLVKSHFFKRNTLIMFS